MAGYSLPYELTDGEEWLEMRLANGVYVYDDPDGLEIRYCDEFISLDYASRDMLRKFLNRELKVSTTADAE